LAELAEQGSFIGANPIVPGTQDWVQITRIIADWQIARTKLYGVSHLPPYASVLPDVKEGRVVDIHCF